MAVSKIRRVDFYPDEFLVGVSTLKHDQIGPYWVVCSLIYSRGGPIDDDDRWIAKACGCHVRTWRAIRDQLVALGKLRVSGGKISNGRSLAELSRAVGRVESAHEAAQASVRARRERAENAAQSSDFNDIPEASAYFGGELTTNQQPATSNQQPKNLTGERESRARGKKTARPTTVQAEDFTPPAGRINGRAHKPALDGVIVAKDWKPAEATREQIAQANAKLANVKALQKELDAFRNWYRAKGIKVHDVEAAFAYWCRPKDDDAPAGDRGWNG